MDTAFSLSTVKQISNLNFTKDSIMFNKRTYFKRYLGKSSSTVFFALLMQLCIRWKTSCNIELPSPI